MSNTIKITKADMSPNFPISLAIIYNLSCNGVCPFVSAASTALIFPIQE